MNYKEQQETKKRILTATIGSLSKFEKYFGFLWGQDSDVLSEREEKMLDIWERVRHEILNFGNNQIRLVDQMHGPQKYKYNFKLKQRKGNEYED